MKNWLFFFKTFPKRIGALILLTVTATGLEGIGLVTLAPYLSEAWGRSGDANLELSSVKYAYFLNLARYTDISPQILIVVTLLGLVFLKAIISTSANVYLSFIRAEFSVRLQRKIRELLERRREGDLEGDRTVVLSLATDQANRALRYFTHSINFISLSFSAFIYSATLLIHDDVVFLVFLFSAGVLYAAIRPIMRCLLGISKTVTAGQVRMISLTSTFSRSRTYLLIRSDVRDVFSSLHEEVLQKLKAAEIKSGAIVTIFANLKEPIFVLLLISVLLLSDIYNFDGVAPTLVGAFIVYRITSSLWSLSTSAQKMAELSGAVNALRDYGVDLNAERYSCSTSKRLSKPITQSFVSKFGIALPSIDEQNSEICGDPTIHLSPGDFVFITGSTGVGKSTYVENLLGVRENSQINVEINGYKYRSVLDSPYRGVVGFVPQNPPIFPCTLLENLFLFSDREVELSLISDVRTGMTFLDDLIREFPEGLNTILSDRDYKISGGQAQRVAIARELLMDPEILVLDEPFNGIDRDNLDRLWDTIVKLRLQKITIVVSHQEVRLELLGDDFPRTFIRKNENSYFNLTVYSAYKV